MTILLGKYDLADVYLREICSLNGHYNKERGLSDFPGFYSKLLTHKMERN